MSARRPIALASMVVLLVGLLLGLLRPSCRGGVPDGFEPLAERLAGFDTLVVELEWQDPLLNARTGGVLRARPDPVVVLDVDEGDGVRLGWSGGAVFVNTGGGSLPILSLERQADDVWGEVRSGFANSSWTATEAPNRGPLPGPTDRRWSRVRLPFDWAQRFDLLLSVDDDGLWRDLVIEAQEAPLEAQVMLPGGGGRRVPLASGSQLWVRVVSVQWAADVPPSDLDPKGSVHAR
jgi:hypothetical protein